MTTSSFSIKSNTSDRELVFLAPRPDHFVVELRGAGVCVTREVYAYTDADGLASLFSKLAASERPWKGTEGWESLEGEFSLSAACSAQGHVSFAIRIRDSFGGLEEWQVEACLLTELGQLPNIAARARSFFNAVASA